MNTLVNTESLRKGQRYLFYKKACYMSEEILFRANLVAVYENKIEKTLVVNNSDTEKNPNAQVCIPLKWITKIHCLDDTTLGTICLPSEILLIIDEYL
jgi:hypothetical protein